MQKLSRIIQQKLGWALAAVVIIAALVASPAQAYSNLVLNPSAETVDISGQPLGWLKSGWGNNTASYSYKPTGQASAHSVRVDVKNYASGDAKWYAAPVSVTGSTAYIYSDYYKSSTTSTIVAQYSMQDGSTQYAWLADQGISSSWKQAKGMLITPPTATSMTLLHFLSSNGYLQIDNVVIKQPESIATTDNVPNSSVEQTDELTPTLPAAWQKSQWGNNTAVFAYAGTGHTGTRSLKVTVSNYIDGDAKWAGDPILIEPGVNYVYSDYYKATAVTNFIAEYADAAGNITYQWLGSGVAKTSWQHAAYEITPPTGTASIRVLHTLAANGYLQIDDVTLPKKALPQIVNGVINGDIEQLSQFDPTKPLGWTSTGWGVNSAKYSLVTAGHNNSRSLRVDMTSYTSGDAKWMFEPQSVTPGNDYLFNAYYQSTTTGHAVVMFTHNDGSTTYYGMHNAEAAPNWTNYRDSFSVPATATSATVFFYLNSIGSFTSDDYSLANYSFVGFDKARLSLTFDDGWEENVATVLPRLNALGFKSTQFYATEFITQMNDPSGVLAFKSAGHEIGSHTVSHPDLTTITLSQVIYELTESQRVLQGIIAAPVENFASPYGGYNAGTVTEIQKLYRSQRTVDEGYNSKESFDRYRLKVQNVLVGTPPSQIQGWVNKAIQDKTWLILVYHRISDNAPEAYDSRVADFEQGLTYINGSGISVETVSQALDELIPQL